MKLNFVYRWTIVTDDLNHTDNFLQSTGCRIKKKDDIRMHGVAQHFKLA